MIIKHVLDFKVVLTTIKCVFNSLSAGQISALNLDHQKFIVYLMMMLFVIEIAKNYNEWIHPSIDWWYQSSRINMK